MGIFKSNAAKGAMKAAQAAYLKAKKEIQKAERTAL